MESEVVKTLKEARIAVKARDARHTAYDALAQRGALVRPYHELAKTFCADDYRVLWPFIHLGDFFKLFSVVPSYRESDASIETASSNLGCSEQSSSHERLQQNLLLANGKSPRHLGSAIADASNDPDVFKRFTSTLTDGQRTPMNLDSLRSDSYL